MTQISDIFPGDLIKASKGANSITAHVREVGTARKIEVGGIELSLYSLKQGGYTFEVLEKHNKPLPREAGLYANGTYGPQQLAHLPIYAYSASNDEWTDARTGRQVIDKAQAVHNNHGLKRLVFEE